MSHAIQFVASCPFRDNPCVWDFLGSYLCARWQFIFCLARVQHVSYWTCVVSCLRPHLIARNVDATVDETIGAQGSSDWTSEKFKCILRLFHLIGRKLIEEYSGRIMWLGGPLTICIFSHAANYVGFAKVNWKFSGEWYIGEPIVFLRSRWRLVKCTRKLKWRAHETRQARRLNSFPINRSIIKSTDCPIEKFIMWPNTNKEDFNLH